MASARDPETGDLVVRAVYDSSEVYYGSFAHLAPDLLVDTVDSYFGMRKIAVGKDARGVTRLLLNGKPLFQYGSLDADFLHQWHIFDSTFKPRT